MRQQGEDPRERKLESILERLKEGTVIVEGKHDTRVLGHLGIDAVPYERVVRLIYTPDSKKQVFLMLDSDKGGDQKLEKLTSVLMTIDKRYEINSSLSRMLLKMLNLTSIEQIEGPIMEIREKSKR